MIQCRDDRVVSYCPIRGHLPLCSNGECREASENDYAECRAAFEKQDGKSERMDTKEGD